MASCALLLKTNPTTLPPCFFENTKSYKTIKEFRCYEVKIEESEKAGGFRSRTQDTLAWAASDLLLSYGNRTTTNPHNPLYVLHKWSLGCFAFLYFHLIISKFLYFQHEARCSEHTKPVENSMFRILCSATAIVLTIAQPCSWRGLWTRLTIAVVEDWYNHSRLNPNTLPPFGFCLQFFWWGFEQ